MSGRKCSTIDFDPERAQRQQLLTQINDFGRDIEGVRRQILDALSGATHGVKEFFSADAQKAEQWIESANHVNSLAPSSLNSSLSALSSRLNELQAVTREGLTLQNRLQEAFIDEVGHLRAEGAKKIFEAQSLISRGDELIRLWFGSDEVEQFKEMVSRIHEELQGDRLEQVALLSDSLNSDLVSKLQSAEANEAKHQRRLYVLKALRQVCAEMGFQEVNPPSSLPPGDRGSRIELKVDTFNRGEVSFYLSLDSIEANSCISQTHCFEEFSQLSNQLAEAFGVITQFKMDEPSPPKLKRKGELEEPNGEEMTH